MHQNAVNNCIANDTAQTIRHKGVTTLDAALGKKQVWHPSSNLRSFGSKCIAVYILKEVLVTLLALFGAPAVIRRPSQHLGDVATHSPNRYAPELTSKIGS